jgi:hypothetical protein
LRTASAQATGSRHLAISSSWQSVSGVAGSACECGIVEGFAKWIHHVASSVLKIEAPWALRTCLVDHSQAVRIVSGRWRAGSSAKHTDDFSKEESIVAGETCSSIRVKSPARWWHWLAYLGAVHIESLRANETCAAVFGIRLASVVDHDGLRECHSADRGEEYEGNYYLWHLFIKKKSRTDELKTEYHFFSQILGKWYSPTPGFALSNLVKSVLLVEVWVAPLFCLSFGEKSDKRSGSR